MPQSKTQFYYFGGLATQDIYSEQEMADALEMSVKELRSRLDSKEYGPRPDDDVVVFTFHAHPFATGSTFEFNRDSYAGNLWRMNVYRWLKGRNEWDKIAREFVGIQDTFHLDKIEESKFLRELAEYRKAWENQDINHHWSIKHYYESHPFAHNLPSKGKYKMAWWETSKHPWHEKTVEGETYFETLEAMLDAARHLSPLFSAALFAPGYSVGDVTHPGGRRRLSWRVKVNLPEGKTFCEECGADEDEISDSGKCLRCGETEMIKTVFYEWDDHKEYL